MTQGVVSGTVSSQDARDSKRREAQLASLGEKHLGDVGVSTHTEDTQ